MRKTIKSKLWEKAVKATEHSKRELELAYKEVREASQETIDEKIAIAVENRTNGVYKRLKEAREANVAGGVILGIYGLGAVALIAGPTIADKMADKKAAKLKKQREQEEDYEEDYEEEEFDEVEEEYKSEE